MFQSEAISQKDSIQVTPEFIESQGLTIKEYGRIQSLLGRNPNWVEVGVFGTMWSEHCSYKSSKVLLKTLPTKKQNSKGLGQMLVKAGEENAGVVDIGDGWAVCFKIESHNHPSAIEPFEGAATGIGGIVRDIFTMGARPVLLTNSLRFGDFSSAQTKRLFRGVVSGIAHYGNCIGIPNVGGDIYFDKCYEGNPLVNALCLGILRHEDIKRGAAHGIGNPVYYVGAPTGRDGLGGASFASRELTEESIEDRPAVQKGDPFMEKLLLEACLEMMAIPGLVVGIQDMGAAGLTCAISETAARGGMGIQVDLEKVPVREQGMHAYEFLLSESQERMLVIIQKGRESEIEKIFEKWDLHATNIGTVTSGNRMLVKHNGTIFVDVPASALVYDGPIYNLPAKEPKYLKSTQQWSANNLEDISKNNIKSTLEKLLADPTIASKKWVWQQYDHMVMAGTAVTPGSDAAVVRLRLDDGKEKFIAISNDCNNRYCYANPYRGAVGAVVECLRNLACSGARPLGLTNNLNFGNPNKPENFFQLKECVQGMGDACRFFDVPVVGGNVSLYNEHEGHAIDPTPIVSVVGLVEKKEHITKQWVQNANEHLILLGSLPKELGMSAYIRVIYGLKQGNAPEVNLDAEKRLHDFLLNQIISGKISAAHDLSDGGLLVAISEMFFSDNNFGVNLDFTTITKNRIDTLLFGESQGRIIISVNKSNLQEVLDVAKKSGVEALEIGSVNTSGKLSLSLKNNEENFFWNIADLKKTWENAIPNTMNLK